MDHYRQDSVVPLRHTAGSAASLRPEGRRTVKGEEEARRAPDQCSLRGAKMVIAEDGAGEALNCEELQRSQRATEKYEA